MITTRLTQTNDAFLTPVATASATFDPGQPTVPATQAPSQPSKPATEAPGKPSKPATTAPAKTAVPVSGLPSTGQGDGTSGSPAAMWMALVATILLGAGMGLTIQRKRADRS
ncbi:MAG: hypothetical protein QM589_10340 [Thermomicrobiales bacterium]